MIDGSFGFVGVTASASSINSVFPAWAQVLRLGSAELVPIDLPIDTREQTYRDVVLHIKNDPTFHGALVTTHKVKLFAAASDLFDEIGTSAATLGEVSCISKRDSRLIAHAKDPVTAGRSIEDFVPSTHFQETGAHVLCLGAGGAGLAIAVYLLSDPNRSDRPDRLTIVNRSAARLEECHRVLNELDLLPFVELIQNEDPSVNDRLMAELPPGSLVVNATGMGKDRPGSPVTDNGLFPTHGLVWELNYRGELDFLHQARSQITERSLTIEDGWRYFVHGWSEVVAEVFDLELDTDLLDVLADEAAGVRS